MNISCRYRLLYRTLIQQTEIDMTTATTTYAEIKMISSKTYAVIDSANQCRFATPSERKAKNFLNKLLKAVNQQSI